MISIDIIKEEKVVMLNDSIKISELIAILNSVDPENSADYVILHTVEMEDVPEGSLFSYTVDCNSPNMSKA